MKYIITESQFDVFFRRRLSHINDIIDSSFNQLLKMYGCETEFKHIFTMLCDDVLDRVWDAAHRNREASAWESYEEILDMYLQIKESHYKMEYNKRCK